MLKKTFLQRIAFFGLALCTLIVCSLCTPLAAQAGQSLIFESGTINHNVAGNSSLPNGELTPGTEYSTATDNSITITGGAVATGGGGGRVWRLC